MNQGLVPTAVLAFQDLAMLNGHAAAKHSIIPISNIP